MKVISPMDDTPASKAGIKSGDMITRIDGNSVQGLSLDNMIDAMRGPPDTKVTLTIERGGEATDGSRTTSAMCGSLSSPSRPTRRSSKRSNCSGGRREASWQHSFSTYATIRGAYSIRP
jgi:hypothetical protein